MKHIVALSGGKDSTAMALVLKATTSIDYEYLITPTGNEMPEMVAHWERLESLLGKPLTRITNRTLEAWIDEFNALPNWRQRWCTRLLKIEPCLAYIRRNQPATLYVGLRADEPLREGIYSADVQCRFPLRELGWRERDVKAYLQSRGVSIPERTDCAWCYGQRLAEWKKLLERHPDLYAQAERLEQRTGATFRSPRRDNWPAGLADLRVEFSSGRKIRGEGQDSVACRACTL